MVKKQPFIGSFACDNKFFRRGGLSCDNCINSRSFRLKLTTAYTLPKEAVPGNGYSFKCPRHEGKQRGTLMMQMREPPKPAPKVLTDEQKQRMAQRRAICETCDHQKGFGRMTVKCKKCSNCGGKLPLLSHHAACRLGKWPENNKETI